MICTSDLRCASSQRLAADRLRKETLSNIICIAKRSALLNRGLTGASRTPPPITYLVAADAQGSVKARGTAPVIAEFLNALSEPHSQLT